MSWGEALRLTFILAVDPTSQVCAALAGWVHPLSFEGIALRDTYDLLHQVNAKKRPKPYPRPWDKPAKKHGAGSNLSLDEYQALRDRHQEN
jgi:hypothetical protein